MHRPQKMWIVTFSLLLRQTLNDLLRARLTSTAPKENSNSIVTAEKHFNNDNSTARVV